MRRMTIIATEVVFTVGMATSVTIPGLAPGYIHYWQVRAVNSSGPLWPTQDVVEFHAGGHFARWFNKIGPANGDRTSDQSDSQLGS